MLSELPGKAPGSEGVLYVALASACQAAFFASNCMTGVSQAIKVLEVLLETFVGAVPVTWHVDDIAYVTQEADVTNAGLGSNLTLEGSVEADASIMLGDKTFAAIGAAPGPHRAPFTYPYHRSVISHTAYNRVFAVMPPHQDAAWTCMIACRSGECNRSCEAASQGEPATIAIGSC